MVYLLLDDRSPNQTKLDLKYKTIWHAAGGALHIWMGYVIAQLYSCQWGAVAGAVMWYFFDGFVNSYVLKKEWWYIGTTAWIDKVQRSIASWIHEDPRLISAIVKNMLLVGSVINLIMSLR